MRQLILGLFALDALFLLFVVPLLFVLLHGPPKVPDHPREHPAHDDGQDDEDGHDLGRGEVQGHGAADVGAGLLVPTEFAVSHAVAHEVLVDARRVVAVVLNLMQSCYESIDIG